MTRQLEAFTWWIDQPPENKTSPKIAERFNCSISTAEKWRAKFGKMLQASLQKQIGAKLKEYVDEYEQVQKSATETAVTLSSIYQTKANELKLIADSGGEIETEELNKITSGMKSAYSLAESASGADVAKKRLTAPGSSESSEGANLGLPDLGEKFNTYDVEATESDLPNDSANEISRDSAETLENKGPEKSEK